MITPYVTPVGAWPSKADYDAEQARDAPRFQRRDYSGAVVAELEDDDVPPPMECRYEHRDDGHEGKCDAMDLTIEQQQALTTERLKNGVDAAMAMSKQMVSELQKKRNAAGAPTPRKDDEDMSCKCNQPERRDVGDAQAQLYGDDPLFWAQRRLDSARADARDARLDAERAKTNDAREEMLKANRSAGRMDGIHVGAGSRAKGG